MQEPQFVKGKPLYIYMKELREYELHKSQSKYELILEFVNKISDSKFKSLCDFKNIDIDDIDMSHFDNYKDKLESELKVKFDSDKVIDVLSTCVESINYSIYRKRCILKPKNKNPDSSSDSPDDRVEVKKIFLSILNKPKSVVNRNTLMSLVKKKIEQTSDSD
jgi:hypothetical protein